MKRTIASLFSLAGLVMILAGCAPIYSTETQYNAPKSTNGKICINQCETNRLLCKQSASISHNDCLNRANQQASEDYSRYVSDQRARNLPVVRTRDSYYDKTACSYESNNCDSLYNSCYSSCGGQIVAQKVCVAFCDK
jgi:hypothetical protein